MTNKNVKTQLVVFSNDYQVTNKQLNTNLKIMLDAMNGYERSTWKFAHALYNIIENELYVDDFKTLKAFADKLGIAGSILSRVKFGIPNMETLKKYGYDESNMTLSKSYILYRLEDNQVAFLEWCKKHNVKLDLISEKKMVSFIDEFVGKQDKAIETGEST